MMFLFSNTSFKLCNTTVILMYKHFFSSCLDIIERNVLGKTEYLFFLSNQSLKIGNISLRKEMHFPLLRLYNLSSAE